INSILISLIYKSTPEEVRLIMVDPKMIELGMYNGIPHLLIPVVTDPKKAAGALNWAVGEMMRRYRLLSEHNVRTLEAYNEQARANGEPTLPQIVIVIDELADLMFVAAREVEESIARIAQMARAAGMHLIIATQRPSADVITGIMKANIPSRVAFAVASQIESRIILDQTGAEKLIGRGDMLYNPLGAGKPQRVQGCFISTKEVESVIEFVKNTGTVEYSQEIMDHIERQAEAAENGNGEKGNGSGSPVDGDDPLLLEAISVVVERGEASTSLLQRKLKLGYARAARLIDIMEERGIVGPFEGSKPRSVTLTRDQWKEMQLRMQG
ncbi:MAG: DNA translocase FtsK, partial [Clostridia bacterium]|nr:DNA translocase FtsK [Clostridia bacterium]